jgi:site-specific recombinase XerD
VVTLERATERHLRALAAEGRAENTLKQYETIQRVFRRFVQERCGRTPTVADLTVENVRAFAGHLQEHGRSRGTVSQYLADLKIWSAFLTREYAWKADPFAKVVPGKRRKRPPETLTEDEFARMLDACQRSPISQRLRNRAILYVLIDSGLRVSELCALELDDVTYANARRPEGAIRVRHGKGDKERVTGFGLKASKALAVYIEDERPETHHRRVFIDRSGKPMGRTAVLNVVKTLAEWAGVSGKRVSPHVLRHTAGTNMARQGMSAFKIMAAMGHERAEQSLHYIRLAQLAAEGFKSTADNWGKVR